MSIKKTFGEKSPVIDEAKSSETLSDLEIEMELAFSVKNLDAVQDSEKRVEIFGDILKLAQIVSENNWERASDIVTHNIRKMRTHIPDDQVSTIIDIAVRDPQIDRFASVINTVEYQNFKELADIEEVTDQIPENGAISLLNLAEYFSKAGSVKRDEIQTLRSSLDPRGEEPQVAGPSLH